LPTSTIPGDHDRMQVLLDIHNLHSGAYELLWVHTPDLSTRLQKERDFPLDYINCINWLKTFTCQDDGLFKLDSQNEWGHRLFRLKRHKMSSMLDCTWPYKENKITIEVLTFTWSFVAILLVITLHCCHYPCWSHWVFESSSLELLHMLQDLHCLLRIMNT